MRFLGKENCLVLKKVLIWRGWGGVWRGFACRKSGNIIVGLVYTGVFGLKTNPELFRLEFFGGQNNYCDVSPYFCGGIFPHFDVSPLFFLGT